MKQNPTSLSLVLSALLSPLAMAGDGTWSATAGGNWSDPLNWSGGTLADGSGSTASFTSDIGAATAVTLDSVRSIGHLAFSDNGAAGSPWTISTSTLTLAGTITPTITAGTDATVGSVLAGNQGLTKSGAGLLKFSATNTYTGTTAVSAGKLEIAPTVILGNNATHAQSSSGYSVASGATLRFDGSTVQGGSAFVIWDINPVSISSGGTLELATTATIHSNVNTNAVLLYWGASDQISGSGSINKEGDGVIDVNGNGTLNSFTGTININGGSLALQGPNTSSNGTYTVTIASGATFDIRTDSHKIGALNGAGNVVKSNGSAGTLTIGNGDGGGTLSGNISNNGYGITKAGTGIQILSGTLSYNGATTVNGGTLVIDGTSTNSAFAVNTGGTLGGVGSIGGAVTVNSGGVIAPGSGTGSPVGMLTVNNTLTLKPGSTTKCELLKTGAGLSNDQFFTSTVNYGGTLEVTSSGDALVAGDEFKLFDSITYGGTFGTVTLPSLPGSLVWDQTGLATTGTIRVSNQADIPVFSPGEGNSLAPQTITMSSGSGTTVYYTFVSGGAEPPNPTTGSASGAPGSGVATVNLPSVGIWKVKAFATKPGLGNSAVALGTFTLIPTPVWTNTAGGFWSDLPEDAPNWLNSLVANGSGIPADFSTLTLPADTIVTLDGERTIGSLLFGDAGNQFDWTLDGFETLTLAGTAPSIAVNNQTATVAVPLAGSNGLSKTGAGELVLAGGGALSGGTAIHAGTLTFKMPGNSNWTLNGGTKTIASGATIKVDMSPQTTQFNTTSIGGTVIPGGATLELYGTNNNAATFYVLEANTWMPSGTGTIKVTGGASIAVKTTDFSNFTGTIEIENGQFANNSANTGANNKFNVNVASGSKLDMRADGITFNALNGAGSVMKSFNGFVGALTIGNGDGNGNFSGPMTSQTNSYSLVKTGTGTQVLGGALSYGGTTTVNGGKLVINGTSTGSAFTVASGGTLGGTGSIAGAVTVSSGGSLAPGESVGTLTLGSAVTLDASSTYAVEITGAASTDKIVSSGTINANGTIKVSLSGYAPVAGDSFDIADGAIAGTPVFDFSAAVLAEGLSWDTSAFATSGVIKASSGGYSSWIATKFPGESNPAIIGTTADPDKDGLANVVEFVLDADPASETITNLPTVTASGSNLVFSFTRRDDAEYLNPRVEFDADLQGPWTTAIDGGNSAFVVQENGAAPDTVTVTIPKGANPRLFARLVVTP